jgi:hypothetical protein
MGLEPIPVGAADGIRHRAADGLGREAVLFQRGYDGCLADGRGGVPEVDVADHGSCAGCEYEELPVAENEGALTGEAASVGEACCEHGWRQRSPGNAGKFFDALPIGGEAFAKNELDGQRELTF